MPREPWSTARNDVGPVKDWGEALTHLEAVGLLHLASIAAAQDFACDVASMNSLKTIKANQDEPRRQKAGSWSQGWLGNDPNARDR
jgi:hypothetical protein